MGKAEARDLGLEGGALYDPEVNYRRVKGELWDWADDPAPQQVANDRSEEHTSELQSLMRISYAVFCLQKKNKQKQSQKKNNKDTHVKTIDKINTSILINSTKQQKQQ